MACKLCGKIPNKKYFDRIYCRECIAKLKESYWKSERVRDATRKEAN